MNFLSNLYKRIKTISSFSDFSHRLKNLFVLIYKICIGHYGEKYWEERRINRKLSKEERFYIDLKTKLRKIEILNSSDEISKAIKNLDSIKEQIFKLNNKTLTNIFFNEYEIAKKQTVLKSYPRDMIITLTNKCNLNCIMCFANESNFELNDRAFEDIKTILPYLKIVRWMGGEAFLYDKFNVLFEEANKHSIKQEIITNGLLLNKNIIDEIVVNDVDLALSIDGITKEVYEKIRINGKFEKLLENLQYLKEKRQKENKKTFIRLNVVIIKHNYNQIIDFIDFCKKYDINMIEFTPLIRDIRNKDLDIFVGDINKDIINEVNRQISIAIKKAKEYGIILNNLLPDIDFIEKTKGEYHTFNFKSGEESLYCHIPWKKLFISSNGNVFPNCFCSVPIGNINDESLFNLWNNDKMQEYRKRIIAEKIKDFCSNDCFYERMQKNYRML
jgi:MoaA/NifB/PqqE/SkfB family radical SAM enzyme